MQAKQVNHNTKRVSLDKLISQTHNYKSESKLRDSIYRWGRGTRNCSVYDFFGAFLCERRTSEEERFDTLEWLSACTKAMLDDYDIAAMTMKELSTGIATSINREGLDKNTRWALYELCFMLVSLMTSFGREAFTMIERCERLGTPYEEEEESLFKRAAIARKEKKKALVTDKKPAPIQKLCIEELLKKVEDESCTLTPVEKMILPSQTSEIFATNCLMVKHGLDPGSDAEFYIFGKKLEKFAKLFRDYNGPKWDVDMPIKMLAEEMTFDFKLRAERRTPTRYHVLEVYELCYEFITLMADPESCKGHRTLMELEGHDNNLAPDAPELEISESAGMSAEDTFKQ